MEIGKVIKQYRESANISLRDFAAKCGTSHSYIAMLESGKNSKTGEPIVPSITKLQVIAKAMGIQLNDLINLCEDMPVSLSDVPSTNTPKIGALIKSERIKNNLSQEDVAKAIGSTKQAVYKYENGIVTNIPMDKISIMADLFGVTPAYLMGWEEEEQSKSQSKTKLRLDRVNGATDFQLFGNSEQLDEAEQKWLDLFRSASDDTKNMMLSIMEMISDLDEADQKTVIRVVRSLGQE